MSDDASRADALAQRVSRLEEEVAFLRTCIESLGVTKTGELHRPGEFHLTRARAASSRP